MREWTTRSQSEILLELGLDPNTSNDDSNPKIISWSFLRLYSLLPTYIDGVGRLNICRNGEETTEIRYGIDVIFGSSEPMDAMFDMVCWLLKNNKLNK